MYSTTMVLSNVCSVGLECVVEYKATNGRRVMVKQRCNWRMKGWNGTRQKIYYLRRE